ncbi:hypothetical protein KC19_2G128100 [Ceratodon purpureus]|uniref:GIL1/IRKI C-terminal domain-containing protein n=1 Tax=Ceratodon purpureus TaxID=3225 RepID=A0A8T0IW69_CERPU|nr:hypothetical protein KC19_2G128100 [Ceratodon purpureus]
MESVVPGGYEEEDEETGADVNTVVGFLVIPGFQVSKSVVKCEVYLRNKNSLDDGKIEEASETPSGTKMKASSQDSVKSFQFEAKSAHGNDTQRRKHEGSLVANKVPREERCFAGTAVAFLEQNETLPTKQRSDSGTLFSLGNVAIRRGFGGSFLVVL